MSFAPIRIAVCAPLTVLTLAWTSYARAGDEAPHKLGDHPAIVVQRLYKAAGYDYASKFYPHPAWLRLYAAPPTELPDAASNVAGATEGKPASTGQAHDEPTPASKIASMGSAGG
jgi:hypothetical protein